MTIKPKGDQKSPQEKASSGKREGFVIVQQAPQAPKAPIMSTQSVNPSARNYYSLPHPGGPFGFVNSADKAHVFTSRTDAETVAAAEAKLKGYSVEPLEEHIVKKEE
jgi:hypothetical protein